MYRSRLEEQQNSRRAPSATLQLSWRLATRRANKAKELTSFIKTVLQLVVRAHVRASAVHPVVLVELPVVQLVVDLVGGGV